MDKTKVGIIIVTIVLLGVPTFFLLNRKDVFSDVIKENVEALSRSESSGMLWKKVWASCHIERQIIVEETSGQIQAGIYLYDEVLIERLDALGISYRIIGPDDGQKSYCYDGWNFCREDECR